MHPDTYPILAAVRHMSTEITQLKALVTELQDELKAYRDMGGAHPIQIVLNGVGPIAPESVESSEGDSNSEAASVHSAPATISHS